MEDHPMAGIKVVHTYYAHDCLASSERAQIEHTESSFWTKGIVPQRRAPFFLKVT